MKRRGSATLFALVTVAVVGATVAALAVFFASDVKRSIRQAEEAQLRQLLLAGQVAGHLSPAQPGVVKLPAELETTGWALNCETASDPAAATADRVRVRVTARSPNGRAVTQTLLYARDGERWKLLAAEI